MGILKNKKSSINLNFHFIPIDAYQTCKTSNYFPNKDRLTDSVKSRIIYQFNCGHCGGYYTGETTLHLSTRVAEHISGRPVPSEVSLHQQVTTKEKFKAVLITTHTKISEKQ